MCQGVWSAKLRRNKRNEGGYGLYKSQVSQASGGAAVAPAYSFGCLAVVSPMSTDGVCVARSHNFLFQIRGTSPRIIVMCNPDEHSHSSIISSQCSTFENAEFDVPRVRRWLNLLEGIRGGTRGGLKSFWGDSPGTRTEHTHASSRC